MGIDYETGLMVASLPARGVWIEIKIFSVNPNYLMVTPREGGVD